MRVNRRLKKSGNNYRYIHDASDYERCIGRGTHIRRCITNAMRRKGSSVKERQEISGIRKAKGKVAFSQMQARWSVASESQ